MQNSPVIDIVTTSIRDSEPFTYLSANKVRDAAMVWLIVPRVIYGSKESSTGTKGPVGSKVNLKGLKEPIMVA